MAVYRIGDILRMKREALGITREKLCELSEEICSPQTLYRMECGKVKVKQEVYRKLMTCMGELPERSYASIKVSEYQALNIKREIQILLLRMEYEQAEEKLEELEQYMEENYIRNKQYLLEIKSKLAYYKQEITEEEYLDRLWKALSYTIPSLNKIDLNRWPINCVEFDILLDILNVYNKMKWWEKEEELLVKLKENAEKKYMEEIYYVTRHTQYLAGLAWISSVAGKYNEAVKYSMEGIDEYKSQYILWSTHNLLYEIAWNKEKLIEKGRINKIEREDCKKLLVQAYYLCISQGVEYGREKIKQLCDTIYNGEIKLL